MTLPVDETLRSAKRITLYDPKMPSWQRTVVEGEGRGIRIPVNSGDLYEVQRWLDRIEAARANHPRWLCSGDVRALTDAEAHQRSSCLRIPPVSNALPRARGSRQRRTTHTPVLWSPGRPRRTRRRVMSSTVRACALFSPDEHVPPSK
jgi:hypothetical protein